MSLKTETIKGTFWSSVEKLSLIGVQFVLQLVLARLLTPYDYGIVGILAVFIAVANTFIDCGFAAALIQNQKRTESDFSTAFYFNLVLSIAFYIILFFTAPYIALFYKLPILTSVTRVIALVLPISAMSAVNRTKLQIKVDFKTQTKASLSSVTLSGIVGIILAYNGFGVWALVFQMLLNSVFNTILLFVLVKWIPIETFSLVSLKKMYSFGIKLLGSNLIDTFYFNMYPLIIGKVFTPADLGFYSRGHQFAYIPNSLSQSILGRVTFPVFSKVQDDLDRLFNIYRKYLRVISSLYAPTILILCAVAKPLIITLLGEKWFGAIIIMQILCIACIFDCVTSVNMNLLYVKGYTNIVLKLNIIKKIIAFVILFVFLRWGVVGLCWGQVLYAQIAVFLNTYYTKKILGLSYFLQMRDILPIYVVATISAFMAYVVTFLNVDNLLQLVIAVPLAGIVYILLAYILKFEIIIEIINFFNTLKSKRT